MMYVHFADGDGCQQDVYNYFGDGELERATEDEFSAAQQHEQEQIVEQYNQADPGPEDEFNAAQQEERVEQHDHTGQTPESVDCTASGDGSLAGDVLHSLLNPTSACILIVLTVP